MARLDTGWHANPKVLQTGAQGMALHAWSISYCDHALSDGFIPAGAWPAFLNAGVKALVRLRLWESVEGGYRLHDYTDYNKTRAQVESYMAEKREAGRVGGQASAQARARRYAQPSAQAKLKQDLKQDLKQNSTPVNPVDVSLVDLAAAAAADFRTEPELPALPPRAPARGLSPIVPRFVHLDHLPPELEDRRRQQQQQQVVFDASTAC